MHGKIWSLYNICVMFKSHVEGYSLILRQTDSPITRLPLFPFLPYQYIMYKPLCWRYTCHLWWLLYYYSILWLPPKYDYKTDNQTNGQTSDKMTPISLSAKCIRLKKGKSVAIFQNNFARHEGQPEHSVITNMTVVGAPKLRNHLNQDAIYRWNCNKTAYNHRGISDITFAVTVLQAGRHSRGAPKSGGLLEKPR